jgi:hypothetical protein
MTEADICRTCGADHARDDFDPECSECTGALCEQIFFENLPEFANDDPN